MDPKYTYNNTVNTDDVEKFFSSASGQNLKPFFDFYLRTVNKLEISVKQTHENKYKIQLTNFKGMKLPMEVLVNGKITTLMLDEKETTFESDSFPQIDPTGFYLKRVVFE